MLSSRRVEAVPRRAVVLACGGASLQDAVRRVAADGYRVVARFTCGTTQPTNAARIELCHIARQVRAVPVVVMSERVAPHAATSGPTSMAGGKRSGP